MSILVTFLQFHVFSFYFIIYVCHFIYHLSMNFWNVECDSDMWMSMVHGNEFVNVLANVNWPLFYYFGLGLRLLCLYMSFGGMKKISSTLYKQNNILQNFLKILYIYIAAPMECEFWIRHSLTCFIRFNDSYVRIEKQSMWSEQFLDWLVFFTISDINVFFFLLSIS